MKIGMAYPTRTSHMWLQESWASALCSHHNLIEHAKLAWLGLPVWALSHPKTRPTVLRGTNGIGDLANACTFFVGPVTEVL
jgi:hypothetical protein